MAIDPLHRVFQRPAWGCSDQSMRVMVHSSYLFYADDVVVFANPNKEELRVIASILRRFGDASVLLVNMDKTEIFISSAMALTWLVCCIYSPQRWGPSSTITWDWRFTTDGPEGFISSNWLIMWDLGRKVGVEETSHGQGEWYLPNLYSLQAVFILR